MSHFIPFTGPHNPAQTPGILRGMLRRIALLGFLWAGALSIATPARADAVNQPEGWGIGVMLGSPTGLTVKRWMGGSNAWDVGLGFGGFGFNPGFRLHADYLWGLAQILPDTSDVTLDLYLGVGPVVGFGMHGYGYGYGGYCNDRYDRRYNNCGTGYLYGGGRVPLGIDLRLQKAPIEFAVEIAPGAVIHEYGISGLLDGMLIARFLF